MSANKKDNVWISQAKKTLTPTKYLLANLSVKVRTGQFALFQKLMQPTNKSLILDLGATSDFTMKDANMFEQLFKLHQNLTIATIEEPAKLKKKYPKAKIVEIKIGEKLPFKRNQFDIVTAWATIEHVGGKTGQTQFLKELDRVGKKAFLTTPYRFCVYEPHSEVFFLHWLPESWFRRILKLLGKDFWAEEKNLRSLGMRDTSELLPNDGYKMKIYYTLFLPTHLIIYKT